MSEAPQQKTAYDQSFYDAFRDTSLRSARAVVPMVMELVRPTSVADAGCGLGIWLSVFREHGVTTIHGMDGEYVDRRQLQIPGDCFQPMELARPRPVGRTFDLAVSLEVAEHLPPRSSEAFADFLVSLAPVLLFSAAVPGQEGTCHINPRWHEWWHEQFDRRGYDALDPLRHRLWFDERVSLHYRQNVFVYVRRSWLQKRPENDPLRAAPRANCLTLLDSGVVSANLTLRATVRRLPGLAIGAIRRALRMT